MPGALQGLLALLAGAALPLAFAPLNLLPLAFLAPAVLFRLWLDAPPRRAALLGFLFGLGQFGVGVSWVYVAIHDVGGSAAPVAALLTALLVIFLALYPALAGALAARLRGSRPCQWLLLVVPAVWTGVEWLRGWLFTGFTWLQLGYSQIDLPLAGLAPWLGVYGVSWATAFSAALLVAAVRWAGPPRIGALIGLGALWLLALGAGRIEWSQPVGEPLRVALVQGNVPQITKWDPEQIRLRLDTYAKLTRSNWNHDLILWPENALTLFYHRLEADYLRPLAEEGKAHGATLIIGVPIEDPATGAYWTTLAVLGDPPQFYRKRHLVPFGEYIPLGSVLRRLVDFFNLPMTGFSPGAPDQTPLIAAGQKLAPSICYEDAFGEELLDFLPESTVLVNGSNNAWYGDSFAPHQHLQINRMRSLETARPMLRVTTNGISAIVDHHGLVRARSRQFEAAVLTGTIQPRTGATPYVRFGNIPVIVLLFLTVFVGLRRREW